MVRAVDHEDHTEPAAAPTSSTATSSPTDRTPGRSTRCSTATGASARPTGPCTAPSRPTAATDLAVRVRGARPRLRRPGHHVLPLRPGAAVPAGHRAPRDRRRRVEQAAARDRAARAGAGGVPRRHLRRRRDRPRRRAAPAADHELRALPPRRGRAEPAQRRAHPRRGHRRRPRRGGHLPGAGGQPAQPVRGVLRDGEPPHDGARVPRPVHPPAGARGRRLLGAPPAGPARGGRAERGRPDGRGAHPRRLQLRVLRALAARPADGRRAGGGPGPVLPRQRRLHAHHGRRAAGRRDLPADRRRVPRPAAVQPRLGARRRGRAQRGPRGPRRDRERGGQRRGRRQARLHLRARR